MISDLPAVVAQFVEASNARDLDRFLACFAADAVVEDEAQIHHGLDELREWKRRTEARFHYSIQPIELAERAEQSILTATLTGDFPGSPVELTYEFTIADGVISALTIHP